MNEDTTANLTMDGKLNLILERLTALEAKSFDTRPIWEQALAEILEVRQRTEGIERELRKLNSRIETMPVDLMQARSDIREITYRVDDLERPHQ
jgi:phage shock protein A